MRLAVREFVRAGVSSSPLAGEANVVEEGDAEREVVVERVVVEEEGEGAWTEDKDLKTLETQSS